MATVREIAGYLEERVPSSLKLDFDNVGLLCGFPEREVSRVLVVLDITQQTIEEALSLHAELIVSHHPVIFTPLRRVCTDTPDAKRVIALLQGNLSAICLHTNLDALEGGVNTALANAVGGEELEYTPGHRLLLPSAGGDAAFEFLAQTRTALLRARHAVLRRRTPCRISGRSAAAQAGTFSMRQRSEAATRY